MGRILHLVSHVDGPLRRVRHGWRLNRMRRRSLVALEPRYTRRGERVRRTTCFNSCAGEAHLVHADPNVVRSDYNSLRKLQPSLFAVRSRGNGKGAEPLYLRRGTVLRRQRWVAGGQQLETVAQVRACYLPLFLVLPAPYFLLATCYFLYLLLPTC